MLQKPFQITVASSKNPIDWKRSLANNFPSSNLTRLLSHHIQTKILDPSRLPSILLLIRTNMFPNNSLGPGRVPPTPSEALAIKTKCATAIIAAIPPVAVKQVFAGAGEEEVHRRVEDMLDAFGDAYLNKHLIVGIVDLVIVKLFPELAEQSISSILKKEDGNKE